MKVKTKLDFESYISNGNQFKTYKILHCTQFDIASHVKVVKKYKILIKTVPKYSNNVELHSFFET